jgi:hypothetical protein
MARTRRKHDAPKGSTREKGDVLEKIIVEMHEVSGVKIERNQYLPSIDGSGRTREIDILITSQVAGFPVRIVIECKNEKKTTDIERIDAFIGKLQDIGIPVQHGVFVSTSRYASGSIEHAKRVGIRTFLLRDISDKLAEIVKEAIQSVIYLLLTITNIGIVNDISVTAPWSEVLFFRDDEGKLCGSLPDLVWDKWIKGNIEDFVGEHEILFSLPTGWHQIIQGQEANIKSIKVTVSVIAIVLTLSGTLNHYQLIDAKDGTIEKNQIKALFNPTLGKYPINEFRTEQDLVSYLHKQQGMKLSIGRFRLPRIRWLSIYWPPSKKAMLALARIHKEKTEQGQPFDMSAIPLTEIEGDDLNALWEPIAEDHPFLKRLEM